MPGRHSPPCPRLERVSKVTRGRFASGWNLRVRASKSIRSLPPVRYPSLGTHALLEEGKSLSKKTPRSYLGTAPRAYGRRQVKDQLLELERAEICGQRSDTFRWGNGMATWVGRRQRCSSTPERIHIRAGAAFIPPGRDARGYSRRRIRFLHALRGAPAARSRRHGQGESCRQPQEPDRMPPVRLPESRLVHACFGLCPLGGGAEGWP